MAINFDLNDLLAFRAVAELGNFRRAAELVHLSQPAFSRRIDKLEQALGVRLLKRTARRVTLTTVGREFERKGRDLLADLDSTLLGIRGVAATRMGEVTVACVPSTVYYHLSEVLARYHAVSPKVRVKVMDAGANDVLLAVQRGDADFGLNFIGAQEADIDFTILAEERFVAACRRDHPVAGLSQVSWAQLAQHDFIAVNRSSGNRLLLDQALAGLAHRPQAIFETQHVTTLLGLVEAGLGVAAVPAMAMPGADHPTLVSVPLVDPVVTRQMGLIRRRGRALSPAAQQLFDLFTAVKPAARRRRAVADQAPLMRQLDQSILIAKFSGERCPTTIRLFCLQRAGHPQPPDPETTAMHPTSPSRRLPQLALALAATAVVAQPAAAQGTVAISGILDVAVRSVNNEGVGSMKSMVSGSNATSRIAFTGREDLGNGLSAGFHLEHGIAADTGSAAAKFWDRRSTVSLSSKSLGELRLGRDFVPSYSNWGRYDPFAYVGVARTANLVSATPQGPIRAAFGNNTNTTVRADNALQLLLPAGLGGLEGGLMWTPGEGGAVASGLASLMGVRLGFAGKGFGVSAATTSSENSQTTAGKFRDTAVGGHAMVGKVRVSAAWREFKYATSKQTLLLLGATAEFGMHEVKASWTQANLSGKVGATVVDANDASQWGVGYVYNMSKRTALYATAAQISNDGAARFVISDGAPGIVAGGSSRGYEAGLRHRF